VTNHQLWSLFLLSKLSSLFSAEDNGPLDIVCYTGNYLLQCTDDGLNCFPFQKSVVTKFNYSPRDLILYALGGE
jgi:hypothetical protein